MGTYDIHHDEPANILKELQYQSIISVVLGDYHFAALKADGNLLTWGKYSSGALGLGNPIKLPIGALGAYRTHDQWDRARRSDYSNEVPDDVETTTPVRFDYKEKTKRDKFCFAVAASGWHTGALVLDPDSEVK